MISDITRFKGNRSLKFRVLSLFFVSIFFVPVAKSALAEDPKEVVSQILNEAIPEFQSTMASMSQGCGGGPNGVPPLDWSTRQDPGNKAVKSLSDARVALKSNQIDDAKKYIGDGLGQWGALISVLGQSCSGGPGGKDPTYYGRYVGYTNQVRERLLTAIRFLQS